jgi:hypothetical protein
MSDTVNLLGFEGQMTLVQALVPQVIADDTPVLSDAIDTRDYDRHRILILWTNKETTATAHTMALTATESATSGGSYSACTTSGTLTAISADGVQWASVKRNPTKPFLKLTLTGSHADVDVIASAMVLFVGPGLD